MNFEEILKKYKEEGFSYISKLTPEQLDLIQKRCNEEYDKSCNEFPHKVEDACKSIKNILTTPNPIDKIKDDAKNISNN